MAMFFSELRKENRQSFVVVIIIVLSNLVFVSLLVCQIFGQLISRTLSIMDFGRIAIN